MYIISIYLGQRLCTDSEYMYENMYVLDTFIVTHTCQAQ